MFAVGGEEDHDDKHALMVSAKTESEFKYNVLQNLKITEETSNVVV